MTERAPSRTRTLMVAMIAVFVVSLGARVGFLMARGIILPPDAADYMRLAENIRHHGAFSLDSSGELTPTIRRAPMYPLFLAVFIRSAGVSVGTAATAQIVLDSFVATLILLLANLAVSLRWAVAAALAYAIYPGSIYFSTTIVSEPLFTALLVVGVLLLLYGYRWNRVALTATAGAVFGMAILCRPIALPIPFLLFGITLLIGQNRKRRWLHAPVLVACLALVLAPWLIRCARVAGHFVFVQGFTPTTFYVATRTDWDQKDQERLWPRFSAEDPYGRRLNAARTPAEVVEADRFGLSLALQNIRANPRGYLASRIRACPYLFITSFDMFTGFNKSFGRLFQERGWWTLALKLSLLLIFSLLPILLAIVGIVTSRRNLAAMLCATVWVYTLVIHLPVWIEYRYWIPAIPFVLISAACGAEWACSAAEAKIVRSL